MQGLHKECGKELQEVPGQAVMGGGEDPWLQRYHFHILKNGKETTSLSSGQEEEEGE